MNTAQPPETGASIAAPNSASPDAPTAAPDAAPTAALRKFQALLRELFQFDHADLDFGIYRIMNHKRDAVERFIADCLPAEIDRELSGGHAAAQHAAAQRLADARSAVAAALGPDAVNPDGSINPAYANTPLGEAYIQAQAAAQSEGRSRADIEASICNRLYAFFSRYYQDGDFISKRRYSRSRYAIPYNGEEVYLHWANSDQYYVKTGERFRNYEWRAPNGVAVRFRLQAADVEQNNAKGEKRCFVPIAEKTEWNAQDRAVAIPFEYRPLTAAEAKRHGRSGQQDKIVADAAQAIPARLADAPDAIAALSAPSAPDASSEQAPSALERHMRRYTHGSQSDFFVHKDLGAFLNRELDFYIKNEVLNLDDIASAGESAADGWFQQMRLIKRVGGNVIQFLAQIENFQKTLWEKRKFIVDANYCVAMKCVPEALHAEIAANSEQLREWRDLYGLEHLPPPPQIFARHRSWWTRATSPRTSPIAC